MVTENEVMNALSQVMDPEIGRSLVELKMIHDLKIAKGGKVSFTLALTVPGCPLRDQMAEDARRALMALPGVKQVDIAFRAMSEEERGFAFAGRQSPQPRLNQFNQATHFIAVMSGKGGVGKSSVTALLACALARQGKKVGILDADITGPSIPRLFGLPPGGLRGDGNGMLPAVTCSGIKVISINLLVPAEDVPVIWRGPMISGAITQFWNDTLWGKLDVLLVDMPPGTSDAALTVLSALPVGGVLMVTMPQGLSSMVVRKAVHLANELKKPVLGVVENMSYYTCPDSGKPHYIFGPGHAEEIAVMAKTEVLIRLPIDPRITELCDAGKVEDVRLAEVDALAEKLLIAAPIQIELK
jgi:Mrp family chromosome partitioning ATPase